jgi:hypothetical protein
MVRECRIITHRCILEELKIDDLYIFPISEIYYVIFSTLPFVKSTIGKFI